MLVLDSDILSLVQRGQGQAHEQLVARFDAYRGTVFTTVVTLEEQMRGWLALIARYVDTDRQVLPYAHLHALVDDFATRPILDFDLAASTEFARLRSLKVRIGTMDLKIAAITIANRATLITRNRSDFSKVPGLVFDDWTM